MIQHRSPHVFGPSVNTAGLTSEQSRAAVEWAGAEADSIAAAEYEERVFQAYRAAQQAADDAEHKQRKAERRFKALVSDWSERVTYRSVS